MMTYKTFKQDMRQIMPLVRWRRLAVAAILFWTPVVIFSKLANDVREREMPRLDNDILFWLREFSTPTLNAVIAALTEIGGVVAVGTVTVFLIIYLWMQRHHHMAVFAAAAVGGAGVLNFVLKHGFERQRPTLLTALATESGYSFPSGHAMLSSALALTVILIIWHTQYRRLAIIIGSIYVVLVGFTRLYLGVHYPTDVLAGWCVSAAWVLLVYTVVFKGEFLLRTPTVPKRKG